MDESGDNLLKEFVRLPRLAIDYVAVQQARRRRWQCPRNALARREVLD